MKRKTNSLVYTNIGLAAKQHKRLKHLAVEESKDMASLVREAIDIYLDRRSKTKAPSYSDDFVYFKMGHQWLATEERPYRPQEWSQVDRDLYGDQPGK